MPTSLQKINIAPKKVLIAPLDWGLGHATRCITIIKEFKAAGYQIFIAAEGAVAILLQKEFPHLNILPLKGYRVSYSKKAGLFLLKMMSQFPKIKRAIKYENKWLEVIVKQYKIDIVISDNRYGMYNKNCHTIFITHQLSIKTGNSFTEWIAQKINYHYINKFNECWVPDVEGSENLAGQLSHPTTKPKTKLTYVGILSRFTKKSVEEKNDLVVMLSGPEPQRTLLEKIMLDQLIQTTLKTVLVRGLPKATENIISKNSRVTIINHLPANELNDLISSAKIVIARSGYSTVMDLAVLQQLSILIPTPGQTEQEYLASFLAEKKYCIRAEQEGFNLQKEIENLKKIELQKFSIQQKNLLTTIITALK